VIQWKALKKDKQMTSRNNHFMPWGNQHQGQEQHQGQAEMQAQLQGQLQGQGQGQHQEQSSENHNGNLNGNGNGNLNGNANGNLNYNENAANNAANNAAANRSVNSNDTDVNTTVKTNVDVDASVDLTGYMPTDDDFADIDLSGGASVDTLLVGQGDISFDPGNEQNIEDILNDALNGAGNDVGTVNSQFNNLVDSDVLHNATVDGNLEQTNTSTGGDATSDDGIGVGSDDGGFDFGFPIMAREGGGHGGHGGQDDDYDGASSGNWGSGNGDDGYVTGESLSSAASAIDTTAFNQSIVMGANVLGNTVDMSVVGGNMNSTFIGDDSTDAV
jgi:hypothetical protein